MRWRILIVASLVLCLPAAACAAVGDGPEAGAVPSATTVSADLAAEASARGEAPGIAGSTRGPDPYWPLDGNGGTDALHYKVKVGYDFGTGILSGRTKVRMRALADLRRFSLDLVLPVTKVTVDGRAARFRTARRHELKIKPKKLIPAGSSFKVKVSYRGRPSTKAYAGENSWLADRHEVVTMGQPHMAPWWFPSNDHPSDKATFDVRVKTPRTKQVISNGERISRKVAGRSATTRWRTKEPMATYLAFFAAGNFAVQKGTSAAGIPYYNAVSRQLPSAERKAAARMLRRTAAMTDWLQARLGPYPFSSTGGLVTGLDVNFALENQTRPTYGSWIYPSVMVHELAHQWFGDSVAVQRWRDIWLNEGFATYLEAEYAAAHGGPSVADWLMEAYDQRCRRPASTFWTLDLSDPGADQIFNQAVYDRGALVLGALRNRIGEGDFTTLLRTWVADHEGGNATVEQFEVAAESVSGQDLAGFFHAWLRAGTVPSGTAANGLEHACP